MELKIMYEYYYSNDVKGETSPFSCKKIRSIKIVSKNRDKIVIIIHWRE